MPQGRCGPRGWETMCGPPVKVLLPFVTLLRCSVNLEQLNASCQRAQDYPYSRSAMCLFNTRIIVVRSICPAGSCPTSGRLLAQLLHGVLRNLRALHITCALPADHTPACVNFPFFCCADGAAVRLLAQLPRGALHHRALPAAQPGVGDVQQRRVRDARLLRQPLVLPDAPGYAGEHKTR